MYEYIIPQEFNQSDRIGNFTIPQAMILGFGLVLVMFLISSGLSLFFSIPLSLCILALTFYVMTKKVNSIPIYEFALVYITFRSTPKLLIYRQNNIKEEFIDELELLLLIDDEE